MDRLLLTLATLLLAFQPMVAQEKQGTRTAMARSGAAAQHANTARGSAPANDECTNAETITVSTDCDVPIAGNNAEATDVPFDVPCDDPGSELLDVWYTFNSGSLTTVYVDLAPGAGMTDHAMVVYDGCAGEAVYCMVAPVAVQEVEVAANTDYWIRVYSNLTYGVGGAFTLCVSSETVTPPTPPNDLCADAAPQVVALGSSVTFNGDNTGATDSEGIGYNSAWEAFTINSCADMKLDFCGTTPNIQDFWLLLYTSCPAGTGIFPSSYDTTTCDDGNFTLCFPDLAPGTYYYGLAATNNNTGPYTMTVSAEACAPDEAANDDCSAAMALTVNATCLAQYFTNACATESLPAVTCGTFTGDASDDVWYSFVATATEITIGGAPRGNMDVVLELFQGSCGNLTSIGCSDVNGAGGSEDLVAPALTVDDTYYLRVYDFRPQFAFGEPGFDLCVVEGASSGVGLSELNTALTGTLYPNPSTGVFTITVGERAAQVDYTITDATGRMVLEQRARVSNGRIAIDATGVLSAGHYTVRIDDGLSMATHRLLVNQ